MAGLLACWSIDVPRALQSPHCFKKQCHCDSHGTPSSLKAPEG
jgi:hypothetical protein